ncbi:MAG: SUMF1/EgtB/PvdO family nonheme iron enzyme [Planctomycetota bacterium]
MRFTERVGPWPMLLTCAALVAPCRSSGAAGPPTIESDLHMLAPREFHADTTKLVQMLRKGHAGVQLDDEAADRMVVRGGSWYDRPKRCRSAFRLAYPPDQLVFDVGFRVICEVLDGGRSAADK